VAPDRALTDRYLINPIQGDSMATETETITGDCPTHGIVEATRDIPEMAFPPLITAVRRAVARRRPYRCPICGTPVRVD
jgi:hypothetical protein